MKNEIVTVTTSVESIITVLPTEKTPRLYNRAVALIEKCSGKLNTKQDIIDFLVHYIMNDSKYNLKSVKYNFDQTNPNNAQMEAEKSYATFKKHGFIIPLN